jgi:hypothetical protein
LHFISLGGLGLLAAIISASVVLQRNANAQADRVQTAQSSNVPKIEAQKALTKAEEALTKAEAAASAECADSGRSPTCKALEQREKEARQRVDDSRTRLAGLGAHAAENPNTAVLGSWAGPFQQAMAVAPAIWLEAATPLLAFGFAPWPRKVPAPRRKAKRRGRRAPKPAPQVRAQRVYGARPRLVAANDA